MILWKFLHCHTKPPSWSRLKSSQQLQKLPLMMVQQTLMQCRILHRSLHHKQCFLSKNHIIVGREGDTNFHTGVVDPTCCDQRCPALKALRPALFLSSQPALSVPLLSLVIVHRYCLRSHLKGLWGQSVLHRLGTMVDLSQQTLLLRSLWDLQE